MFKLDRDSSILVVGDIILDHYLYGICERISPEAPVPVVDFKNEKWILGGAANVANNLSSMGVKTFLTGVIGQDENGNFIDDLLDCNKINNLLIKSEKTLTTMKSRIISGSQQLLRVDREIKNDIDSKIEKSMIEIIQLNISQFDCIILSDYNKGVLTSSLISTLIEIANKNGIKILVDPKGPPFTKYNNSYLIKPNKKEAYNETGIDIKDLDSFKAAAKKIQNTTNCKVVVITLSEDGLGYYENENAILIPTQAKQIYDVTGAGDTFIATLAFSLVNNISIIDSCHIANYAAGIVIAKQGCVPILFDDLKHFFN